MSSIGLKEIPEDRTHSGVVTQNILYAKEEIDYYQMLGLPKSKGNRWSCLNT